MKIEGRIDLLLKSDLSLNTLLQNTAMARTEAISNCGLEPRLAAINSDPKKAHQEFIWGRPLFVLFDISQHHSPKKVKKIEQVMGTA